MNFALETELAVMHAMNVITRMDLGYVDLPPVNQENPIKQNYYLNNGTFVGTLPSEDDQDGSSPFKVPQDKAARAAKKLKPNDHPTNGDCMYAAPSNMDQRPACMFAPVEARPSAARKLNLDDHPANSACVNAAPSNMNQLPSNKSVPSTSNGNGACCSSSSPAKKMKLDHHLRNGTYVGLSPSKDDQPGEGDTKSSPFKVPPVVHAHQRHLNGNGQGLRVF